MKEIIKKSKIFPYALEMFTDIQYVLLNYIVNHIPIWTIRKLFYCLAGMKIGKQSRIHMCTIAIQPKSIVIGNYTIINEGCFLDGRGGLVMGDGVSISIYSTILSASHKTDSESFEYYDKKVIIEDCVWLGAKAMILEGSHLKERTIIGAGSVFKGESDINGIYIGVPAKKIKNRSLKTNYQIQFKPYFR